MKVMIKRSMLSHAFVAIGLFGGGLVPLVHGIGWGAQLQQDQEANAESVTRSIGSLAHRASQAAGTAFEVSARKNARGFLPVLTDEDDTMNKTGSGAEATGHASATTLPPPLSLVAGDKTKPRLDCDYADPSKRHMCPPIDKMQHPAVDARSGRWSYVVQDKVVDSALVQERNNKGYGIPLALSKDDSKSGTIDDKESTDTTDIEQVDPATRANAMMQVESETVRDATDGLLERQGDDAATHGLLEKQGDDAAVDGGASKASAESESPLVLFARCLDDPDDPACRELQSGVQPPRRVVVESPTSARGLRRIATDSPTKDDCYGNMVDERFCASTQPSLSIAPSAISPIAPSAISPVNVVASPAPTNCEDREDRKFLIETRSSDEYVFSLDLRDRGHIYPFFPLAFLS